MLFPLFSHFDMAVCKYIPADYFNSLSFWHWNANWENCMKIAHWLIHFAIFFKCSINRFRPNQANQLRYLNDFNGFVGMFQTNFCHITGRLRKKSKFTHNICSFWSVHRSYQVLPIVVHQMSGMLGNERKRGNLSKISNSMRLNNFRLEIRPSLYMQMCECT